MPNILKVTTPAAGYDNNSIKNNPMPPGENLSVHNPVDPSRVMRGDNRSDAGGQQEGKMDLNLESNFQTFINQLRQAPEMAREFAAFLFGGMAQAGEAASREAMEAIAEFLEVMNLPLEEGASPDQTAQILQTLLKSQAEGATRLNGRLFDVLRDILSQTSSVDLKAEALDFARSYTNMSLGSHLLNTIRNTLKEIGLSMYSQNRADLETLSGKMNWSAQNGDTAYNTAMLQKSIIPYLSRYISRFHDMGRVRSLISSLAYQVSQYANGDQDGVVERFARLLRNPLAGEKFAGLDEEALRGLLNAMDYEKAAGRTEYTEKFYEFLRAGAQGRMGLEARPAFEQMIYSMLLNESVYVPLLHLALPLCLDGQMVFSEIWADPDANKEQAQDNEKKSAKLFIRLDIRELGHFELVVLANGEDVNLQVYYPDRLDGKETEMKKEISAIIQKNHLNVASLELGRCVRQRGPEEVFPEIYEKRSTVNVRV